MKEEKVDGRNYTSNLSRLTKHLNKLDDIQHERPSSPIMIHMSLTNKCNLTCDYCCYGSRELSEKLSLEQAMSAIDQFSALGTKGLELSVKGDELIPFKNNEGDIILQKIEEGITPLYYYASTLDDKGNFIEGKVTDFVKHPQTEPLWKITLKTGKHVTVTKSHSIFFWEENKIVYKPVSESKVGDLVIVSLKQTPSKNKPFDKDIARLYGYYTAEGCLSYQRDNVPHGIIFTFGKSPQEMNYVEDVVKILRKMGYNPSVDFHKNKTVIRCSRKELCELFIKEDFGCNSNNKRVPNIIFNIDRESRIEYLAGLFAGDGNFRDTVDNKGYRRNSLHLKTSSVELQRTVSFLLEQLGVNVTVGEGINKSRLIEGRKLPSTKYYTVNIYGKNELDKVVRLIDIQGKILKFKDSPFTNHTPFSPQRIGEDSIALPIKFIEEVPPEKYVYDISVSKHHSFLNSFGIMCHNTGGGDPSMHPQMGDVIRYAKMSGMDVGLITNGINLKKFGDYSKDLQWMRVSLHGLNYGEVFKDKMGETVLNARKHNPHIDISSVYIWTKGSDKTLEEVASFTDKYKIPTRVTPDLTLGKENIDEMMYKVGKAMERTGGDYLFLSDFNVKTDREHDRCYMHLIKPFVFTDGNVYDCPSLALSPENGLNVNDKFKVCSIEQITETYSKPSKARELDCNFCKYSMQNEFIDDLKRDLKHDNFA